MPQDVVDPRKPKFTSETITVRDICDAVGRSVIMSDCGVGASAVSRCIAEDQFTASWLLCIRARCRMAGLPCPLRLFNMISPPAAMAAE